MEGINIPERGKRGFDTAKERLKKAIGSGLVGITPVAYRQGRVIAEVRKERRSINNRMRNWGH